MRDFYSEKPIKNAKVTLWLTRDRQAVFETKSDRTGGFTVQTLPAGRYDIRISPRGYFPAAIKELLIPRENGVHVDTTVLELHRIVVCQ